MAESDSGESTSSVSSYISRSSASSRLSEFVDAKTELQDIYHDLSSYLSSFLTILEESVLLRDRQMLEHLCAFSSRVEAIAKVLSRDRMKVAFFGRTSNGKSAVINALLHEKILPSAMGHTTSCFCQVQANGSDETTEHVKVEQEEQHMELSALKELASAHSPRALKPSTLLQVNMAKNRCSILDYDVVLMDTPGVDVTAQLDDCLDSYCMDADVFILVLNAESTVSRVERQFFKDVASKLSRPNLFILNNRWDKASSLEPEMEQQVKDQHMERCVNLLVDELGVYANAQEAWERIYHVSALEALHIRNGHNQNPTAQTQERYQEFLRFENDFSNCLAESALKTKFGPHLQSAQKILNQLKSTLIGPFIEKVSRLIEENKERRANLNAEMDDWVILMQDDREELQIWFEQLTEMTQRVGQSVLNEQINTLIPSAVLSFAHPFHPEFPAQIGLYQRSLSAHLDELLEDRVLQCLSMPLQEKLFQMENELELQITDKSYNWQFIYNVDCQSYMVDFQPDLRFMFSLGFTALWHRLEGNIPLQASAFRMPKLHNGHKKCLPLPPLMHGNHWQMLESLVKSKGSLGTVLLSALAIRSFSWPIVLILGGLVGSFYLYEYAAWTTAAQERSFKRQYVRLLQQRLRADVQQTVNGFEFQLRQHLAKVRNCWEAKSSETLSDLEVRTSELTKQIKSMEVLQLKLKKFRDEGQLLASRLADFQETYLSKGCKL
ncbi:transmembrane GTPase fzo [Drosophila yakuba]|uniref:Dynamin-type G domain-containing protein n=1 Tax=Drosophila yakuba TaxID=7245 RepID=A0A0R1E4H1_DROYA|nr:transmembrane GTPase fzo [Drosophila yakuba]KRK04124.1 uncharacterized protein Dyak_GE28754 [Drosophila yakuba]